MTKGMTETAVQVADMLQVLKATESLVQAAANLTSSVTNYTWLTADQACESDGPTSGTAFSIDGGLGRDDVTIDYDSSFFSFVGCRCTTGYDNVYTVDAEGASTTLYLS